MDGGEIARFRTAVAGGLAHLESRRQEVNDLNVFPVADGDTGDNMALTLRAVLAELDRFQEQHGSNPLDEVSRAELVESVARAALLGARGNSGVILSQLIRGAAEELASRPGELVDSTLISAAMANAADRAYASVRNPAEGTILTVAREMARMMASDVAHVEGSPRLGRDTAAEVQDSVIARTLERGMAAGQDAVMRGPELLAVLREAGVVDAGGYGLTVIFAGVIAALHRQEPPELDHHAPARITHPEHTSLTYRYCTNFAVTGAELRPGAFIEPLKRIGDSVLVVGDATTLKVHVHTDDPELATAVFAGVADVSRLDVADMSVQVAERDERLLRDARGGAGTPADEVGAGVGEANRGQADEAAVEEKATAMARCGAVAVAAGAGIARMFSGVGAHVVDGGSTVNPSTYELLAGIHEVQAEEVVVLPCSANVVMAAERAAELSEKEVVVVPALSQQAGLAAAVALQPESGVRENAAAMAQAIEGLRTGAVAEAAKEDAGGRFARGDAVGLVEGEVVASGTPEQALLGVLEALGQEAEIVSVLAGAQAPLSLEQVEQMVDGTMEAELELREGGQDAYWWLVGAE